MYTGMVDQAHDDRWWQALLHIRRMDPRGDGADQRAVVLEEGEPGAYFKVYGNFPSEDAFMASIESYLFDMNVFLDEVNDFCQLEGNPVPDGIDETCMQQTEDGLIVFTWNIYLNEDA